MKKSIENFEKQVVLNLAQIIGGHADDGGLCVIDNLGGRITEDDSGGLCVVDNVDL